MQPGTRAEARSLRSYLSLTQHLQAFFFAPASASGFGLMRIAWAAIVLGSFFPQWNDVTRFYGDVFPLYLLLLALTLAMLLGLAPRLTTALSVLLLLVFLRRNMLLSTGGDIVLQATGLLLALSPGVRAFSLARLREQWHHFVHRFPSMLLPPLSVPAWPWRLLLWQIIILYAASSWAKLLGTEWREGTAVGTILLHPRFARWPLPVMYALLPLSPLFTFATLAFEFSWLLLLIPRGIARLSLGFDPSRLRRKLLLLGLVFHLGILILLDVGTFPLAMLAAYLGLLTGEDMDAIRRFWNRHFHGRILIFFDGGCGLCHRSIFVLLLFDHLRRTQPVDFRDDAARMRVAPEISMEDLDRSTHITFPDGRTLTGFDAFRALFWHLPLLWLLALLLYLPGVVPVGRRIYAVVAERRKRCTHKSCAIE